MAVMVFAANWGEAIQVMTYLRSARMDIWGVRQPDGRYSAVEAMAGAVIASTHTPGRLIAPAGSLVCYFSSG